MNFTQSQLKAIRHGQGPCLVLAVPGAGKTTVLLERLSGLIEAGISAENIVSITFSKQQALDMKHRFIAGQAKRNKVPVSRNRAELESGTENTDRSRPEAKPVFSTIHAFCYKIIRDYARSKGEQIRLLEGSDDYSKYQILARLFRTINGRMITDDELEDFFRIDGYLKNALVDYKSFSKKFHEKFPKYEELSAAYSQFKQERNLIDFDDMLVKSLQILDGDPDLLRSLQARFQYIQLDEAQDTSLIQLRIIQLLAAPENNLFMVADDDQAIYGFRGANPAYLLQYKTLYPGAEIIMMEDNHRSTRNIVELSARFIQRNRSRYNKQAKTDDEEDSLIRIYLAKSLKAQNEKLIRDLGADLEQGSVAILFRNNISSVALVHQLTEAGIPFSSRTRATGFFRHSTLRDLLDILEFSKDTANLDAFAKIYYKLNSYLKRTFIDEIARMNAYEDVFSRLRRCQGTDNPFYREKIDLLETGFRRIGRQADLAGAIDEIDYSLGYGEYLEERSRKDSKSVNSGRRIMETLKVLAAGLKEPADLHRRLEKVRRLEQSEDNRGPVLSTIHGAKGLEYDTVWVLDLIQEEFPSSIALDLAEEGDAYLLEEERRLFYVAMTRAKKKLKLVARKKVNGRSCDYSQFIKEITKKGL